MCTEFGPVFIFLATFHYVSLYASTSLLIIATIFSTLLSYRIDKRIPYLALYVALLTTVFGYMTIHFNNVYFLQVRDTLYDLTCAFTLVVGLIFNIPFLKIAFNDILPMKERSWKKLTYIWLFYFVILALLNEIVRRSFTIDGWLIFKAAMVIATCLFGMAALYTAYESEEKIRVTV